MNSVALVSKTSENTVNEGVSVQLKNKGATGQTISIEKDQTYKITFYAKGKGQISALEKAKELIDSNEWKEYTYEFSYDKQGSSAILVEAAASEKLVVDNFKLEKI